MIFDTNLVISFSAKIDGIHKDLQKAIGASLVLYNPDQSVLSVISRSPLTSKRAQMLADMHFRNLNQKVMLLKKTEELARQLESSKLQITSSSYTDEFKVRDDLMGLAIGAHGTNIQQARRVDGITNIELDEHTGIFKIYGEVSFFLMHFFSKNFYYLFVNSLF